MSVSVTARKSIMNRFIGFAVFLIGGSVCDFTLKPLNQPSVQLVPFSQAHFDAQVCSNLLFEGVEVWVGGILVSIVVGVNDLRAEFAHGAAGLVPGHGVRDIDADKRNID